MIQIICTCLTILATATLFFLAQYWAHRHKRTEILAAKLEALHGEIAELTALMLPRLRPASEDAENRMTVALYSGEVAVKINKLALYAGLYFEQLTPHLKQLMLTASKLIDWAEEFEPTRECLARHLLIQREVGDQGLIVLKILVSEKDRLTKAFFSWH